MSAVLARVALAAAILVALGCAKPAPLYQAAYRGDPSMIESLVTAGADPSATDELTGWPPLLIAAAEGHAPAVSALLEAGADANGRNRAGRTALMFAARYGYTRVLGILLAHGADVNLVPQAPPRWPALTVAAGNGHAGAVRILLAHDADPSHRDETGKTAADWALDQDHPEIHRMLVSATP